ncbi:hypothetical protein PF005_g23442 [Phytophthora fragariae]|uniref:PH domain-containing protein n=1 Tax=Phytophthora fragariae TaxID=53985 RepID=A0A6A3E6T0_9STRA|nr:hypothetical protein PF003_g21847 [Phytophthora fragariae]KAE8925578.1 hypothetical protein PF009_g24214 [Phytophthora fragariae]KAE8981988.1 hypothetical protein PF011_g21807 [Phytophthora fragariae]KAE9079309.1 hypothetical protein PF007_g23501 [Phytophthora fragariae]KAE9079388.1 hypothetical protein PF010_g22771 [Phytophthora fragariae]
MEGYLDHLETTGLHKKVWTRRFFKLSRTFHVLEFFTDETQHERRGKMELEGAEVATADELGGLLSDDKAAVEMSRRFIFRIMEKGSKKHHYLCADLSGSKAPASATYALASSTREYLEEWLHALRTTIAAQEESPLTAATMGLGELNAQIGAFMNHMHLSARISNRVLEHGKSVYEITVKAWILERELVMEEDTDSQKDYRSYGRGSVGSGDMSWQILQYSCAWKLFKSTTELRNFDGQLRLLFGSSMHNVVFPSNTIGTKLQQLHLHASASQKEAENQQRLQVYDTYLQSLLRMPAFSSFGSDASTMLYTFLDISPHLASFRKLEKESGQSMHLRDRKVVPWKDRERFQVVYKMHLQVIAAQEENARRTQVAQYVSPHDTRSSHQHRHSHHRHRQESYDVVDSEEDDFGPASVAVHVAPLPAPVKPNAAMHVAPLTKLNMNAATEEARPGESVHERIARIGHRLVIEAFEA